MSRRVSKSISTLFALTLLLSASSAFGAVATPTFADEGPIERVVRVLKNFIGGLLPTHNEDIWPGGPKP